MNAELRKEAVTFLRHHPDTVMATVEDKAPWVRSMRIVRVEEDGTVWYATRHSSIKVEQVRKNPRVCIFATDGTTEIRLHGTAEEVGDQALRHALWKVDLRAYFDGPDDPEYVLMKVTVLRVEFSGRTI